MHIYILLYLRNPNDDNTVIWHICSNCNCNFHYPPLLEVVAAVVVLVLAVVVVVAVVVDAVVVVLVVGSELPSLLQTLLPLSSIFMMFGTGSPLNLT